MLVSLSCASWVSSVGTEGYGGIPALGKLARATQSMQLSGPGAKENRLSLDGCTNMAPALSQMHNVGATAPGAAATKIV